MRKLLVSIPACTFFNISYACTTCDEQLRQAIYDSTFYPNLLTMLAAFVALAMVVFILYLINVKRYRAAVLKHPGVTLLTPVPLATASIVLGIGIGGFADGIVFHQVLQWHGMLSNKIPPTTLLAKSVNMFWDGIFHAFCLLVIIAGVILLHRTLNRNNINRSANILTGGFLIGWALFNIIEGIIDHHILKLHNVREITTNSSEWNLGFLAASALMLVLGWIIVNKASKLQRV